MILKYIEEQANRVLSEHGFNKLPIDVKKLSKKLGVNTESDDLATDIAGIFVIKSDTPFIRYNKSDNSQRQRFTIAHELGHLLLHSKTTPLFIDKTQKIMYRNVESSTGELHMEREANAFAAAILMPENLVKEELNEIKKGDIISQLARKFNVSPQAMSFRLSNLGYDFGIFD